MKHCKLSDGGEERQFVDNYYQARSASQRERAENWAVAIGLQKKAGRLRRVGPDKGGHWEVVG